MHDYSDLLVEASRDCCSWETLIKPSYCFGKQIKSLLSQIVTYKPINEENFYYEILSCYFLLPSALCKNLPLLFLHGGSGSGKSELSKFLARLWNCPIYQPSTTYAGLRNDLDRRSKVLIEIPSEDSDIPLRKEVKANFFMIWDDIDPKLLHEKPDIFRMLKVGCDRMSSTIELSSERVGINLKFDCFSPKVFSSIHDIPNMSDFAELKRRTITFRHYRSEVVNSNLIFADDYDWAGLSERMQQFWNRQNASEFLNWVKTIRESVYFRKTIPAYRRSIFLEVLACGLTTGVFDTIDDAIDALKSFLILSDKEDEKRKDSLDQLLSKYLELNCSGEGQKVHNNQIVRQIERWVRDGDLPEKPLRGEFPRLMRQFGYYLNLNYWEKGG